MFFVQQGVEIDVEMQDEDGCVPFHEEERLVAQEVFAVGMVEVLEGVRQDAVAAAIHRRVRRLTLLLVASLYGEAVGVEKVHEVILDRAGGCHCL